MPPLNEQARAGLLSRLRGGRPAGARPHPREGDRDPEARRRSPDQGPGDERDAIPQRSFDDPGCRALYWQTFRVSGAVTLPAGAPGDWTTVATAQVAEMRAGFLRHIRCQPAAGEAGLLDARLLKGRAPNPNGQPLVDVAEALGGFFAEDLEVAVDSEEYLVLQARARAGEVDCFGHMTGWTAPVRVRRPANV